jgi:transposase-like protein
MNPTTAFCSNWHCHTRGQIGGGTISIHSRKEQRFICHECHKTFSARKGTVHIPSHYVVEWSFLIENLLR